MWLWDSDAPIWQGEQGDIPSQLQDAQRSRLVSGWAHVAVAQLFCSPQQGENRCELATPQPLANIGNILLSGGCSPQRRGRNLAAVVHPVFALPKNHPLQWAMTLSYQGRDPALGVFKARCSRGIAWPGDSSCQVLLCPHRQPRSQNICF